VDNSVTAALTLMKFSGTCIFTPTQFQGHGSKVKVTGFRVFFNVHDAAATRGQYLALSKAWILLLQMYIAHNVSKKAAESSMTLTLQTPIKSQSY